MPVYKRKIAQNVRLEEIVKIIGFETNKTNHDFAECLGVSVPTVARDIDILKKSGRIFAMTTRYKYNIGGHIGWKVIRKIETIGANIGIS